MPFIYHASYNALNQVWPFILVRQTTLSPVVAFAQYPFIILNCISRSAFNLPVWAEDSLRVDRGFKKKQEILKHLFSWVDRKAFGKPLACSSTHFQRMALPGGRDESHEAVCVKPRHSTFLMTFSWFGKFLFMNDRHHVFKESFVKIQGLTFLGGKYPLPPSSYVEKSQNFVLIKPNFLLNICKTG